MGVAFVVVVHWQAPLRALLHTRAGSDLFEKYMQSDGAPAIALFRCWDAMESFAAYVYSFFSTYIWSILFLCMVRRHGLRLNCVVEPVKVAIVILCACCSRICYTCLCVVCDGCPWTVAMMIPISCCHEQLPLFPRLTSRLLPHSV